MAALGPQNIYMKERESDLLLHSAGLAHQQRLAEVASRALADLPGELRGQGQALLLTHGRQDAAHLHQHTM